MLNDLIPEEKRRLHELDMQLIDLQKGSYYVRSEDISRGLQEMTTRLVNLENMASKEPRNKRDDMQRRIAHLRANQNHLQNSLSSYIRRQGQNSYDQQRQELFHSANGESNNQNSFRDLEMAESKSLDQSSKMVQNYLNVGQEALSELMNQRDRLKGVQRKVLDVLSYLGMSTNTMRSIEQRDVMDKYLVFLVMAVILLLLFGIWWFLKR